MTFPTLKPVFLALVLSFTFFPFSLHASETENNTLTKLLKAQKNFQSDYVQAIYQANDEIYEISEGHFFLGANKAFRNDKNSPESTSVISDGKKLWIIDNDLEQVSISRLEDHLKSSPLVLLLDDADKALEHFDIENQQKNVFHLKQKDQYSAFPFIRLTFKQSQITHIEIDEASGKKVRISFNNITPLKQLSVFKAEFPSSYDVVDESE